MFSIRKAAQFGRGPSGPGFVTACPKKEMPKIPSGRLFGLYQGGAIPLVPGDIYLDLLYIYIYIYNI